MLANNNGQVITRMAKRSLISNKRKNGIMMIAIMLSTFMLFSIFTVGVTFLKMQRQQDIRTKGGEFDAYIYGGYTEKQKEICRKNPAVDAVGVEGMAGWAVETEADDTLHSIFIWADDTRWNVMKKPAMGEVRGVYPRKDNEVMATKDALEDCGLGDLDVGDTFPITYQDNNGIHTKELTISGMWEGYGDTEIFYVSRSFFDQSGYTLEDSGRGFLYIHFRSFLVSEKTRNALESSLNLGKKQHFIITSYAERSIQILAGLVGLVGITCLSAYLLIYNILYLSVAGNIRYYGLLQTVGMTGKQIDQLMKKQMLLVGTIGIGGGMMLGMAVSFLLIPMVVRSLGIRTGSISVVFHPAIFFLSILVASITIWLGCRKPAKIATDISPVEALGYRRIADKKSYRKTRRGGLLWRMAREQFGRDKKKTAVVVLSLAASLSVFLCLITLIESQGPRTIVSNYMDADMVISNDTLYKEDMNDWARLMDADFMNRLKENEGIQEVHFMLTERIVVPWEPEVAEPWMREMYEVWYDDASYDEDVKEDYIAHPEKYYSYMTGIDETEFDYLNSTLETSVDKEDFLAGKCGILYRNGLSFDMDMLKGKKLNCYLYNEADTLYEFAIAGLTDDIYYAHMLGNTPTIIVSNAFLKHIADDPYVVKANVQYVKEYDETVEQEIKDMIQESPYAKSFRRDSKIDEMKRVEDAQGNMMGVGIGITLILALIGIMNYINTVSGNIQSRQMELAVMESVGMTEKQVKEMLLREGILFGASSLALMATVGLGVTYVIYQSMNYMDIAFEVPVIPVGIMVVFVVAVCMGVPLAAYRILTGEKTVVERIRIGDGGN